MDDVPGMRRTFGERWRSHASATAIGLAPSRAATKFKVPDCSQMHQWPAIGEVLGPLTGTHAITLHVIAGLQAYE